MCHCLLCDCWWCSWCDIACLGLSCEACCLGFWCCKHDQIGSFDPNCCTCCERTGFGMTCGCLGTVCCVPEWLQKYSNKKKSRETSYD